MSRTAANGDRHVGGHPVTPDGRYFVVRGRLWRMCDPVLPEERRASLVSDLMDARRAVGAARRAADAEAERAARVDVDRIKHALGERGPVWWNDGAADLNRHMARNTIYADWLASLYSPADGQVSIRHVEEPRELSGTYELTR